MKLLIELIAENELLLAHASIIKTLFIMLPNPAIMRNPSPPFA
jgi:hypothetical protein